MRKIISFLVGFLFLLAPILSQDAKSVKVSDRPDTLVLSFVSENPKIMKANDNLTAQLTRSLENQTYVADNLAASIQHISESIRGYLDNAFGPLIIGQKEVLLEYGITTEQVVKSVKKQNFYKIIFTCFFLIPIYFLLSSRRKTFLNNNLEGQYWWPTFFKESLKWAILIIFLYLISTLIFNSTYYDIVTISKLML